MRLARRSFLLSTAIAAPSTLILLMLLALFSGARECPGANVPVLAFIGLSLVKEVLAAFKLERRSLLEFDDCRLHADCCGPKLDLRPLLSSALCEAT